MERSLFAAVVVISGGCNGGKSESSSAEQAARETENEGRPSGDTCLRSTDADRASRRDVYTDLRGKALNLDPREVGLRPAGSLPRVFGVMMETGFPEGCATLVALADGTASLYLSSGGGVIGGGEHPPVAGASKQFVQAAEEALDQIPPARGESLPPVGSVVIRVLTYRGSHAFEASEDDLGYERHDLSPLFYAGQEVITQLRQVDEKDR